MEFFGSSEYLMATTKVGSRPNSATGMYDCVCVLSVVGTVGAMSERPSAPTRFGPSWQHPQGHRVSSACKSTKSFMLLSLVRHEYMGTSFPHLGIYTSYSLFLLVPFVCCLIVVPT